MVRESFSGDINTTGVAGFAKRRGNYSCHF